MDEEIWIATGGSSASMDRNRSRMRYCACSAAT